MIKIRRENKPKPNQSILVINHQGIGDIVLSMPIYKSIRKKFPQATIYSTVRGFSESSILKLNNYCDKFIFTNIIGGTTLKKFLFLLNISKFKFDLIIVPASQNVWNSIVIKIITRCPKIISYTKNSIQNYFVTSVIKDPNNSNRVFRNQNIASYISGESFSQIFPIIEISKNTIKPEMLLQFPFLNDRFVVIHPGSGELEKHKRFNIDALSEVVFHLIRKYKVRVVCIGSPGEFDLAKLLSEKILSDKFIMLIGKTSLLEASYIVKEASLMLSGDSGFMHIASSLGTPTFTFFGPTSIEELAPTWTNHFSYTRNLKCSPCYPRLIGGCSNPTCMKVENISNLISSIDIFYNSIIEKNG